MKKYYLGAWLLLNAVLLNAQNNPIFTGGNGDGWNRTAFATAGNNIFTGGSGDGWNVAAYAQASINLFNGGNGDGWAKTAFTQSGSNIFTGGNGDGWTKTSFLQAGNGIFNGGNGDGWHYTNFLQAGKSIFTGGIGDGWSSTYRPLGPLPVTLLSFTAVKSNKEALLQWITATEQNSAYFDVERSDDAMNFVYIGRVAAAGNSTGQRSYRFTDAQPLNGNNYYRLKQVDIDNRSKYTPTRYLNFSTVALTGVKLYPNPATTYIKIELPVTNTAQPAVLNFISSAGIMVEQLKLVTPQSNVPLHINISGWAKGTYFVQFKTNGQNTTSSFVIQ